VQVTVFYFQSATGKNVSSDDGLVMDIDDVCDQLLPEIRPPDDFLGVVDVAGTTVQVAANETDFWVEIPVPAKKGSYGMTVGSRAEMIELFRGLPETFSVEDFAGFAFKSW